MSTKDSHVLLFVAHFHFPEVLFMMEYKKMGAVGTFRLKKKVNVECEPTLNVLSGGI